MTTELELLHCRLAAVERALENLAPELLAKCRQEVAAEMHWNARKRQLVQGGHDPVVLDAVREMTKP